MPLPNPEKNEEQKSFINRCVGMNSVVEEFPDQKQRVAVCFSQWKRSKKEDSFSKTELRSFTFNIDSNKSNMRVDKQTGFLHAKAILTRSGVFDYYTEDGDLMREYRSDEEVFDSESIKSLEMKPITNDHIDMVTTDNIKELQIGSTGEIIEKIDNFLASNIIITDKNMVTTILNRKKSGLNTELSCGYTCNLIPDVGIHDKDGYYTFVQKNIKYNHVAIVDKARAGRKVRILDNLNNKNSKKELKMPEKIQFTRKAVNLDCIKLDAITKIVSEDSLELLNILSSKLDEAVEIISSISKDKDELQGKFDQSNESIKSLNKKIDSLSSIDSPVIADMIKTRIDIENIAKELEVDCKDKDTKTIMCDCIKAASTEANLDDKSSDYINARFDAVREILKVQKQNDGKAKFASFMRKVEDGKGNPKTNPREQFINKDKEDNRK